MLPLPILLLTVVGALAEYYKTNREPPKFKGLLSIKELARVGGYEATNYEVITEDGYGLWLHRIGNNTGPPVLLQHGIFLCADSWIIRGSPQDLAFYLLDLGFDVWLSNQRGTVNNEYSLHSNRSDSRFWNFSFHEAGLYDIPAFIDTILDIRQTKKLHYIAHSLGTTVFLVMVSSRPEYNSKIHEAILLSPIAYSQADLNPVLKVAIGSLDLTITGLRLAGVDDIGSRTEKTIQSLRLLCTKRAYTQQACLGAFGLAFGDDSENVLQEDWDRFIPYYFAGTSLKTFYHAGQLLQAGRHFQQFDYGPSQNLKVYGSRSPPRYNVSKVTAPVALFWGNNDPLLSATTVDRLASQLPNLIFSREMPNPRSAHLDMIIGADNQKVLYPYIAEVLKGAEVHGEYNV